MDKPGPDPPTLLRAVRRYERAEARFRKLQAMAGDAERREGRAFARLRKAIVALAAGSEEDVAVVRGHRAYLATCVTPPDDYNLDIIERVVLLPEPDGGGPDAEAQ